MIYVNNIVLFHNKNNNTTHLVILIIYVIYTLTVEHNRFEDFIEYAKRNVSRSLSICKSISICEVTDKEQNK